MGFRPGPAQTGASADLWSPASHGRAYPALAPCLTTQVQRAAALPKVLGWPVRRTLSLLPLAGDADATLGTRSEGARRFQTATAQRIRKTHRESTGDDAMSSETFLTLATLRTEAAVFAGSLHERPVAELFGTTDGKALGTWIESSFSEFLADRYAFDAGSAARGIDFPELNVDLKATFLSQPQSSCPFRDASQKVFGLGYHLLVFVYEKTDVDATRTARIDVRHLVFIERERTADHQTTAGILGILKRGGNIDDLAAFLEERNLPLDEIGRRSLAERILANPPRKGYITVSNALQWRLQYGHAIRNAGEVAGVHDLLS